MHDHHPNWLILFRRVVLPPTSLSIMLANDHDLSKSHFFPKINALKDSDRLLACSCLFTDMFFGSFMIHPRPVLRVCFKTCQFRMWRCPKIKAPNHPVVMDDHDFVLQHFRTPMFYGLPSGKLTKSPCLMRKSTISITIFNSFLYVYQAW